MMKLHFLNIIFLVLFIACNENTSVSDTNAKQFIFNKPDDFPEIFFPDNNKYSPAKAFLGQKLFTEKMLSINNSISCASCHMPEQAFSSGTPVSFIIGKDLTVRNVPSILNIAYNEIFNWDGSANNLEEMIYKDLTVATVFFNDTNIIVERLSQNNDYRKLFFDAFGTNDIKPYQVSNAIAVFIRTLISGNSRYDRYRRGEKSALNDSEIRGMELFFSDKTNCSRCHSGLFFNDNSFHNTGTSTHYFDRGRYYVTKNPSDIGKFKTPTLRNIELTSPYKHNGEQLTLEEVIENYNSGGKLFINKDTLIKPLNLNHQEKQDLINFLKSLTDESLKK